MMCCCEKCKFVFESVRLLEQCPDCGHGPVRQATAAEINDYVENRREYGPMRVYGSSYVGFAYEAEMPVLVSVKNGCQVFRMTRTIVPAVRM